MAGSCRSAAAGFLKGGLGNEVQGCEFPRAPGGDLAQVLKPTAVWAGYLALDRVRGISKLLATWAQDVLGSGLRVRSALGR